MNLLSHLVSGDLFVKYLAFDKAYVAKKVKIKDLKFQIELING